MMEGPPNDTGVQLRAEEGAQRPTRPSVCNAWLGRPPRIRQLELVGHNVADKTG